MAVVVMNFIEACEAASKKRTVRRKYTYTYRKLHLLGNIQLYTSTVGGKNVNDIYLEDVFASDWEVVKEEICDLEPGDTFVFGHGEPDLCLVDSVTDEWVRYYVKGDPEIGSIKRHTTNPIAFINKTKWVP